MIDINWHHLNALDYAILTVLGLSILVSLLRGFLREILSILIWGIAIIAALKGALPVSTYLQNMIESPVLRYAAAFVIILLSVLIIGMIINGIIRRLISHSPLGILDRLIGFLFGLARGVLLISLVLLFIQVTSFKDALIVKNSELAPQFKEVVTWLHHFLPEEIQKLSNWTKTSNFISASSQLMKNVSQNMGQSVDQSSIIPEDIK